MTPATGFSVKGAGRRNHNHLQALSRSFDPGRDNDSIHIAPSSDFSTNLQEHMHLVERQRS